MKKWISLLLAAVLVLSLAACSNADNGGNDADQENKAPVSDQGSDNNENESGELENNDPETITIRALNGSKEEVDVEVPYNPQRIAILDFAALDAIDNLGLGDRVVGTATTSFGLPGCPILRRMTSPFWATLRKPIWRPS